jgi:hypothetical protein
VSEGSRRSRPKIRGEPNRRAGIFAGIGMLWAHSQRSDCRLDSLGAADPIANPVMPSWARYGWTSTWDRHRIGPRGSFQPRREILAGYPRFFACRARCGVTGRICRARNDHILTCAVTADIPATNQPGARDNGASRQCLPLPRDRRTTEIPPPSLSRAGFTLGPRRAPQAPGATRPGETENFATPSEWEDWATPRTVAPVRRTTRKMGQSSGKHRSSTLKLRDLPCVPLRAARYGPGRCRTPDWRIVDPGKAS